MKKALYNFYAALGWGHQKAVFTAGAIVAVFNILQSYPEVWTEVPGWLQIVLLLVIVLFFTWLPSNVKGFMK